MFILVPGIQLYQKRTSSQVVSKDLEIHFVDMWKQVPLKVWKMICEKIWQPKTFEHTVDVANLAGNLGVLNNKKNTL